MDEIALALPVIRSCFPTLKAPCPSDRVAFECSYTFDTAFSEGGLYVNLQAYTAAGAASLALDRTRTGASLYLHQSYKRVATAPASAAAGGEGGAAEAAATAAAAAAPTRVALGVPGGFALDAPAPFNVEKAHTLVVFTGAPGGGGDAGPCLRFAGYPSPATGALPEFLATVVAAVLAHGEKAAAPAAPAAWADEVKPSRHYKTLRGVPDPATGKPRAISPNPADWVCDASGCGKTGGLWLNLTTGYIGCGRRIFDGSGGNEHALAHFRGGGGGPLCVKLGTITPAGGDVYSYDEDDAVEDPLLGEHLAFFGINIMRMEKFEKSTAELAVDLNTKYDWSRICEEGKELARVSGPGAIGLENLGNTCYINSTVQLVAAVEEWRAGWAPIVGTLFTTAPREPAPGAGGGGGVREDLFAQTAKLMAGLHDAAYGADVAAPPPPPPGAAKELEPAPGAACGYLVPRVYRSLVGKGHADFSSGAQQDAQEFLAHLLRLYERAHVAAGAGPRAALPLPRPLGAFFEFQLQERKQCTATGEVKYSTVRGGQCCTRAGPIFFPC
jgi:ubiquitin carboxyl-terminal hydrolase 5/13